MTEAETSIEVLKPFGQAFELMQRILFQPFNIGKWLVIGFAAFLASFSAGFHFNVNPLIKRTDLNYQFSSSSYNMATTSGHWPVWIYPLIVIGGLFLVIVVVVLMWLGARGRFILIDCMVRNRGAIQQPWRDFREEGNSFFLFSLLFLGVFLATIFLLGLPLFLPLVRHGNLGGSGPLFVTYIVLFAAFIILLAFGWSLITQLMVPIMFRRRCRSFAALGDAVHLIVSHPGGLVLYFLFCIVLAIACAIIAVMVTCMTCCVAAIPYVGQVILLPLSLTLYGFTLFFLKQFGSEYDVWAGLQVSATIPPPLEPPPLQGQVT